MTKQRKISIGVFLLIILLAVGYKACVKSDDGDKFQFENYISFGMEYYKVTPSRVNWINRSSITYLTVDGSFVSVNFDTIPSSGRYLSARFSEEDSNACSFVIIDKNLDTHSSLAEIIDGDNYFDAIIEYKEYTNYSEISFANVKMTNDEVMNGKFKMKKP